MKQMHSIIYIYMNNDEEIQTYKVRTTDTALTGWVPSSPLGCDCMSFNDSELTASFYAKQK